ncbi:MAG TPA: GntP family permease [Oscillospiraceae bacterium]|nr:GntP family permease [Oscillospiraceae bacterium]
MIGIFIGLALLMFLAYKGMSTIWAAPLCALFVALTGGLPIVDTYAKTYMTGFVSFTSAWFPTFMLGAVFGKVMEITGAARAVGYWITKAIGARFAILAVVLACAAMTYGGISLFVAIFVIYPLAVSVYREANIPRELIPGTFTLGAFTFTMTALPGSPQIQNLIPMPYFGTEATAAPGLGIIAAILMFGLGMIWLTYRQKKFAREGKGFVEPTNVVAMDPNAKVMHPGLCFLPLIAVVLLLNLAKLNIIVALFGGIAAGYLIGFKVLREKKMLTKVINEGAVGSMPAIINTSAVVGFGTVVKAVPGFQTLTGLVMNLGGNPLVAEAVAVNVLCGATGSASGGISIALSVLGDKFMEMSASTGISPAVFHRIASLSSGGLDTLPHNGGVITALAVCGLTHKESYLDMCVTSLVIPVITTVICVILASAGLQF